MIMKKYVLISGVCNYYVYQDVRKPVIGEKPVAEQGV